MRIKSKLKFVFVLSALSVIASVAVAQMESSKGVGPVKELKLSDLDKGMAKKGLEVFTSKCSACHKIEERYVGPALKDITKRRQPEWIMNMILNPGEMLQKDPVAMKLLEEFLTPMTFQNVTQDETRAILEYFRANDQGVKVEEKKEEKKDEKKKDKKSSKKKK